MRNGELIDKFSQLAKEIEEISREIVARQNLIVQRVAELRTEISDIKEQVNGKR